MFRRTFGLAGVVVLLVAGSSPLGSQDFNLDLKVDFEDFLLLRQKR